MYWHNATPKDDVSFSSVPAKMLHKYHVRVKGIGDILSHESQHDQGMYKVNDHVWVRDPNVKCTTRFKLGRLTGVNSLQSVKVDRSSRHVKDLRLFPELH